MPATVTRRKQLTRSMDSGDLLAKPLGKPAVLRSKDALGGAAGGGAASLLRSGDLLSGGRNATGAAANNGINPSSAAANAEETLENFDKQWIELEEARGFKYLLNGLSVTHRVRTNTHLLQVLVHRRVPLKFYRNGKLSTESYQKFLEQIQISHSSSNNGGAGGAAGGAAQSRDGRDPTSDDEEDSEKDRLTSLRFNKDGEREDDSFRLVDVNGANQLVCLERDQRISLYDLSRGFMPSRPSLRIQLSQEVQELIFIDKLGIYAATSRDKTIKFLDPRFEYLNSHSLSYPVVLVRYDLTGNQLIVAGAHDVTLLQLEGTVNKGRLLIRATEVAVFRPDIDTQSAWLKEVYVQERGRRLHVVSRNDIFVYHLDTKRFLDKISFPERTNSITHLVFSDYFQWLIVGFSDGTIRVLTNANLVFHEFNGHYRGIAQFLLFSNDRILVSVGHDEVVLFWSLQSLEEIYRFPFPEGVVAHLGFFNPQQMYLWHKDTISLGDAHYLGEAFANFNANVKYMQWNKVTNLRIPPRLFVCTEDGTMRLLSPKSGKTLAISFPVLDPDQFQSVIYSSRTDKVFVLLKNREIWIFDTSVNPCVVVDIWRKRDEMVEEDCTHLELLECRNMEKWYFLTAGKTGAQKRFVFGGRRPSMFRANAADISMIAPLLNGLSFLVGTTAKGQLIAYGRRSLIIHRANIHTGAIHCMQVHAGLGLIVTGSLHDQTIRVTVLHPTAPDVFQKTWTIATQVRPTVLSVSDTFVACGAEDGTVSIHGLFPQSFSPPPHPKTDDHINSICTIIHLDRQKVFVSAGQDGILKVWQSEEGTLLKEVKFAEPILALCRANLRGDIFIGFRNRVELIPSIVFLGSKLAEMGKIKREGEENEVDDDGNEEDELPVPFEETSDIYRFKDARISHKKHQQEYLNTILDDMRMLREMQDAVGGAGGAAAAQRRLLEQIQKQMEDMDMMNLVLPEQPPSYQPPGNGKEAASSDLYFRDLIRTTKRTLALLDRIRLKKPAETPQDTSDEEDENDGELEDSLDAIEQVHADVYDEEELVMRSEEDLPQLRLKEDRRVSRVARKGALKKASNKTNLKKISSMEMLLPNARGFRFHQDMDRKKQIQFVQDGERFRETLMKVGGMSGQASMSRSTMLHFSPDSSAFTSMASLKASRSRLSSRSSSRRSSSRRLDWSQAEMQSRLEYRNKLNNFREHIDQVLRRKVGNHTFRMGSSPNLAAKMEEPSPEDSMFHPTNRSFSNGAPPPRPPTPKIFKRETPPIFERLLAHHWITQQDLYVMVMSWDGSWQHKSAIHEPKIEPTADGAAPLLKHRFRQAGFDLEKRLDVAKLVIEICELQPFEKEVEAMVYMLWDELMDRCEEPETTQLESVYEITLINALLMLGSEVKNVLVAIAAKLTSNDTRVFSCAWEAMQILGYNEAQLVTAEQKTKEIVAAVAEIRKSGVRMLRTSRDMIRDRIGAMLDEFTRAEEPTILDEKIFFAMPLAAQRRREAYAKKLELLRALEKLEKQEELGSMQSVKFEEEEPAVVEIVEAPPLQVEPEVVVPVEPSEKKTRGKSKKPAKPTTKPRRPKADVPPPISAESRFRESSANHAVTHPRGDRCSTGISHSSTVQLRLMSRFGRSEVSSGNKVSVSGSRQDTQCHHSVETISYTFPGAYREGAGAFGEQLVDQYTYGTISRQGRIATAPRTVRLISPVAPRKTTVIPDRLRPRGPHLAAEPEGDVTQLDSFNTKEGQARQTMVTAMEKPKQSVRDAMRPLSPTSLAIAQRRRDPYDRVRDELEELRNWSMGDHSLSGSGEQRVGEEDEEDLSGYMYGFTGMSVPPPQQASYTTGKRYFVADYSTPMRTAISLFPGDPNSALRRNMDSRMSAAMAAFSNDDLIREEVLSELGGDFPSVRSRLASASTSTHASRLPSSHAHTPRLSSAME